MAENQVITRIPFNFEPRKYQLPVFESMDSGVKRIFLFVHRRAGKDKSCVNLICKRAMEYVGLHYYFFPTFTQGKKIIWDNLDMMQHFPDPIVKGKNSVEMKITLINGSVIQFIGTDNADSCRGTNPITCIFSEYAFHNPVIWDIIRPILNENGGVAIFQTTPNGDNHASELFDLAEGNPAWFTQTLTVEDTKREDGTPVISQEDIDEERRMGMSEEMIRQEYYCDRKVGKVGAYWAQQVNLARTQCRIEELMVYPDKLVDLYSDLGIADSVALWFVQKIRNDFHFVDHYEDNNKSIEHYFSFIDNWMLENGCKLGVLHLPHDGKKRDLTSGVSVYDLAVKRYGNAHVKHVPIAGKQLQIDTGRSLFPFCSFHAVRCGSGVKCLKNYHKEWDEKKKVFKNYPAHDWSSHTADAYQNFAMANKDKLKPAPNRNKKRVAPRKYEVY